MQFESHNQDGIIVVSIEGNVDTNSAPDVKIGLDELISSGANKIIMNLSSMDYISSAGLRVLLLTGKQLKELAGELRLCSMNESVHDVFDISGFSSIFKIFETVEQAQQEF